MTHFLKFLHLTFGLFFVAAFLVNYWFFLQKDKKKQSIYFDIFLLLIILMMFMTGAKLVPLRSYTFTTPWIHAAFWLLGLIFFNQLLLLGIKLFNRYKKNYFEYFQGKWLIHCCIITNLLCLCILIHDAVTKSTVF